jgi:hypothetical protein
MPIRASSRVWRSVAGNPGAASDLLFERGQSLAHFGPDGDQGLQFAGGEVIDDGVARLFSQRSSLPSSNERSRPPGVSERWART